MAAEILTSSTLRSLFSYNQETGLFIRLIGWRAHKAGSIAGYLDIEGYVTLSVKNKKYKAHRLAFLHVTGQWPLGEVDHIDGDRANNTLRNLRDVPQQLNAQNLHRARSHNKLKILGVSRDKKRFSARITVNGKLSTLGFFDTPEEAHQVYLEAKRRLHLGCTI